MGILKEIAQKRGISISEAKKDAMNIITAVAKELHVRGMPWRQAVGIVAKRFWELARQKGDFPSIRELTGLAVPY